ncbi:hypothetical protein D3C76_1711010 [compost metagenome]
MPINPVRSIFSKFEKLLALLVTTLLRMPRAFWLVTTDLVIKLAEIESIPAPPSALMVVATVVAPFDTPLPAHARLSLPAPRLN